MILAVTTSIKFASSTGTSTLSSVAKASDTHRLGGECVCAPRSRLREKLPGVAGGGEGRRRGSAVWEVPGEYGAAEVGGGGAPVGGLMEDAAATPVRRSAEPISASRFMTHLRLLGTANLKETARLLLEFCLGELEAEVEEACPSLR